MAVPFIDHPNQKDLIRVVFFFSWRDRMGAGLTTLTTDFLYHF